MQCKRCGYTWKPKKDKPKQCPKCKQYYYNRIPLWKVERKVVGQEEPKEPVVKKEEVKRKVTFT